MLAVFVIVLGFVTAAFIATASAILQNNDGTIELSVETPFDMVKGFFLCMFIGPYLVVKNSSILWVESRIEFATFGLCILVACTWSFCLGIVAIQTLVVCGIL